MNKDKQSYFAPEEERAFVTKNNDSNKNDKFVKLLESFNAELEKEVREEAYGKIKKKMFMVLSTFAHEMEKEYDEKYERKEQEFNAWASKLAEKIEQEYDKKKKHEKRDRWIVMGVFFGCLIIVTFLYRYSLAKSIFIGTAILGVLGSVITLIFDKHSKIRQELVHIRSDKEPIATGIVKEIMAIIQAMREESLFHLALLLCAAILMGEFFGSVDIIERTRNFANAVYIVATSEAGDAFDVVQKDEETLAAIMAECDETTINMLHQADITQAELNEIIELSQSDYDLVFYLNRKYIDWTDKDQVYEAVWQLISEKRSMQMENVFDKDVYDGGAPQWLRDLVAKASEDEIAAVSFSEIKSICGIRADAFAQCPKKSLANLQSNDLQKLAIILYINGGKEESIIYYYSQSILRDFECLQFAQNSNTTVKEKLISIAQRYRDMVFTCPNMENPENALALAEAFENAANQY